MSRVAVALRTNTRCCYSISLTTEAWDEGGQLGLHLSRGVEEYLTPLFACIEFCVQFVNFALC